MIIRAFDATLPDNGMTATEPMATAILSDDAYTCAAVVIKGNYVLLTQSRSGQRFSEVELVDSEAEKLRVLLNSRAKQVVLGCNDCPLGIYDSEELAKAAQVAHDEEYSAHNYHDTRRRYYWMREFETNSAAHHVRGAL